LTGASGCWLAVGVLVGGCAQPDRTTLGSSALDPAAREGEVAADPSTDPVAFLRQVDARCASLRQYTLTFTRRERRGLGPFKRMRGPERIRCWYRRDPFSVRMLWLDPDVKYGESTYVAGRYDNQVRFVPRHGLFGLPPGITSVSTQTPVWWGEARYPVTDFGLKRTMDFAMSAIDAAGKEARVRYLGRGVGVTGAEVDRIRVTVPARCSPTPITELEFDVRTHLPAVTRLYSESGRLEAVYTYRNIDTSVTLTDEDFLLNAEREPRTASVAGGAAPTAHTAD